MGASGDELATRSAEARYLQVVSSVDSILWEADPVTFEFSFVSPQAERLLGFPLARWEDPAFWPGRLHPDDRAWAIDFCIRCTAEQRDHEFEYRMIAADGRILWFRDVVRVVLEEGRAVLLRGVMLDITHVKAAQEERSRLLVEEREARARAEAAERRSAFLAEASRLLSASLDYATTLRAVSELALPHFADWCVVDILDESGEPERVAVTHTDPACAERMARLQRFVPNLDATEGSGRVLRTGEALLYNELPPERFAALASGPGPFGYLSPDHAAVLRELAPRSAMVVPLVARGHTTGAIALCSTAPERRYGPADLAMAEELGRRAGVAIDHSRLYRAAQEAVRVRDEFLSIASHELKSPLTALRLGVQNLLKVCHAGTPPSRELVDGVLETTARQTQRLEKLMNNLLDVSRIDSGRMELTAEPVDLSPLVHDVVASLENERAAAGSALTVAAPPRLVGRWDRLRLAQVVTNLIGNAIKYGAGKPIEIRVEERGDLAVLEVRDHGIGIPKQQLPRIFDRFERAVSARHYGGLGLGLYIVRRIVDTLRGEILVESVPGAGSTFTVLLPRTPTERIPR